MYQFEMMGNENPRKSATSDTKECKLYSYLNLPLQQPFDISQTVLKAKEKCSELTMCAISKLQIFVIDCF